MSAAEQVCPPPGRGLSVDVFSCQKRAARRTQTKQALGGRGMKKKVFISSSRSEDLKELLELLFFPPGEEDSWSSSDFAHYTSTAGWLLAEYNPKSNPSCVQQHICPSLHQDYNYLDQRQLSSRIQLAPISIRINVHLLLLLLQENKKHTCQDCSIYSEICQKEHTQRTAVPFSAPVISFLFLLCCCLRWNNAKHKLLLKKKIKRERGAVVFRTLVLIQHHQRPSLKHFSKIIYRKNKRVKEDGRAGAEDYSPCVTWISSSPNL